MPDHGDDLQDFLDDVGRIKVAPAGSKTPATLVGNMIDAGDLVVNGESAKCSIVIQFKTEADVRRAIKTCACQFTTFG